MKKGWTYRKLGDVCSVFAGQGAPQGESNYSNIGIPFVKAGNLLELLSGKKESEIQKVSESVAKIHKLKLYKAGSVIFAKSGMSCMKGYVYTLKMNCYVVSHLAILEPNNINSARIAANSIIIRKEIVPTVGQFPAYHYQPHHNTRR